MDSEKYLEFTILTRITGKQACFSRVFDFHVLMCL
jgi:hypothetical protein